MEESGNLAGSHWLYAWMDEFDATDAQTTKERLKSPRAVERLNELASRNSSIDYSHVPLAGSVVAGLGIETDEPGICGSLKCRQPSLDSDIGSLLHYFDYVVMQGPSARGYQRLVANLDNDWHARFDVAQDVLCLQYLRTTGISNHVIFANKPSCFCDEHFKEHAGSLGLEAMTDAEAVPDMARQLVRSGLVKIEERRPELWYGYIAEPLFFGSLGRNYSQKSAPTETLVAEEIIRRDLMSMVYDAAAARMMRLPMASLASPEFFNRERSAGRPTVDEVATSLKIPILSNLTTAQLVQLRERETAHFEAFRVALREAVATSIEKLPEASPHQIGEVAWQEQLKPALADLERRLANNRKSLLLTSGTALTMGTAATAIASVVTAPWAAAMLGAAVASTLPLGQISEYFKGRQQANLSSMYFLWKARKAQTHS